jgi:Ser/Thr protein kinase RdoA (MazF antagonist)
MTWELDFQNESYQRFIEGYRSGRPIEQAELNLIPLFLHVHHLFDFARLCRALTPVNPNGELPWMAGLRNKLAAKMQFYRDELSG